MTFYRKKQRVLLFYSFLIIMVLFFIYLFSDKKENYSLDIFFSRDSGYYDDNFELEITAEGKDIYYTLDGSIPNKNSLRYEKSILISDATNNENIYSIIKEVSAGLDKEEIKKMNLEAPNYEIPEYNVDKATIIRARTCDNMGNWGEVVTKVYFVDYGEKSGYKGIRTLSIISDPGDLFDYDRGIYVTGKTYDKYVLDYRVPQEGYWREAYWALWMANYRNRGIEWERKAECHFFDENGNLEYQQVCGIRIHGGISRGYNPKSLNIYARKEYDGNKNIQLDIWDTGYYPSAAILFQGGNEERTKFKDYFVSDMIKDWNISTMNFEPYVLFLNGEYWGFYWLNEKYNKNYFEYYYGVNKDNVLVIKNGELEDGEEEDINYYRNMLNFCSSSDMTNTKNYNRACEMIDMESYTDYYAIMMYIGRNGDWPSSNYVLWRVKEKEPSRYGDGKWRWAIFDLNSTGFANDIDPIQYTMDNDTMFKNLMSNDKFRDLIITKIKRLESVFEPQIVEKRIEEYIRFASEAMINHNKRFYGDESLDVFYNDLNIINTFFEERASFLEPILKKYEY